MFLHPFFLDDILNALLLSRNMMCRIVLARGARFVTTRALFAIAAAIIATPSMLSPQATTQEHRPRARELGIHPGIYDPGPNNAIATCLASRSVRSPSSKATTF